MDEEIQEINYEDENLQYYYNLTNGQELLDLENHYENSKAKLQNYNRALELLNLKVLKFYLLETRNTNVRNHIRNKNKSINIKRPKKTVKELLILKKLFTINLRSLKVVQRLYQENFDLLRLLESCRFLNEKKRQLKAMIDQNRSSLTAEICFKTKLRCLLNEINNMSNGLGRNQYSTAEAFPGPSRENYRFPSSALFIPLLINSENKSIHIEEITEYTNLCNENFQSQELKMMYQLPALMTFPMNYVVNNYLNSKSISQGERLRENIEESSLLTIFNNEESTQLRCDIIFRILNNTQKYPNITEISYITIHRTNLQPENINLHSLMLYPNVKQNFVIYSNMKKIHEIDSYQKLSNLTKEKVPDNVMNKGLNDRIQKYNRKRYARYNPNNIHKYSNYYKNLRIGKFNIKRKVNIGVGESSTLFLDQESQVDFLNFIDGTQSNVNNAPNIDTIHPIAHKTKSLISIQSHNDFNNVAETDTTYINSHHDFKESLLSLQKIIEYCKGESEQDLISTSTYYNKFQKTKINLNKKTSKNSKHKNIVTEKSIPKTSMFHTYKKENCTLKKMPEMNRLYQIVLQNETPEGVRFNFFKFNKLNGDTFFIKNRYKSYT